MNRRLFSAFILIAISAISCGVQASDIQFRGEMGRAEEMAVARFFQPPFTSLSWLRADLTNEEPELGRRFRNYNGDVSGRYLELMTYLASGNQDYHPALRQFIKEIPSRQQADGHFGYDEIDWSAPLDFCDNVVDNMRMTPIFWGNGRFLCGVAKASSAFHDPKLLECAKKLGDFYILTADRFMAPAKIDEYNAGANFAGGYTTCYFHGMEGLIELYRVTGEKKYLDVARQQAEFYKKFDFIPINHTHGMLNNQYALVLLYKITGERDDLARVENRWNDLVDGGYIAPPGGIYEICRPIYNTDEGCAVVDWLRLNLELAKVTGNAKYWNMAERVMQNHFLANQYGTGGFGHRAMESDQVATTGFGPYIAEATWCCDMHGTMAFELIKPFLLNRAKEKIEVNFALDFTSPAMDSVTQWIKNPGQIMSQTITVKDSSLKKLLVRIPDWAEQIADSSDKPLPTENGFAVVSFRPGQATTIIYQGDVMVENRRCGRAAAELGGIALRYGPKVLVLPDHVKKPKIVLPVSVENGFTVSCQPENGSPATDVQLKWIDFATRSGSMGYVFESVKDFAEKTTVSASSRLIPSPRSVEPGEGIFILDPSIRLVFDDNTRQQATFLEEIIQKQIGRPLSSHLTENDPDVRLISLELVPNADQGTEGYTLKIAKNRITIIANASAGLFHGIQTLHQLILLSSQDVPDPKRVELQAVTIEDRP